MDDFLSTLYRGEVHPNEGCGRHQGEMLSLERLGERLIGDLKSEISEKAAADLEKYISCQKELGFYIEEDAFARGVSFTARFLVSALDL